MRLINNSIITSFCFLLLFSCDICEITDSNDPNVVTFSDINFEILIRDKLNKPTGDISKSDMLTISDLYGQDNNIKNINGIQYCENLEYLSLVNNQIIDISYIKNLTKLKRIDLPINEGSI